MPLFTVRRRVDAYVDYVTKVSARSARGAARKASTSEESFDWEEDGGQEFDARLFITLDENGAELEETELSVS